MTEPPGRDGTDDALTPGEESVKGAPRWVKIFGGIALVLIVLLVVLLISGGHGPGRHTGSDRGVGETLPRVTTGLRG